VAAEVKGIRVSDVALAAEEEPWSRADAMCILAVREALGQAGVNARSLQPDLILGTTTAGMFETESLLADLSRDAAAIVPSLLMHSLPLSSVADHVSRAVGPFRSVRSVCSACTGGANAIVLGAGLIRSRRSRLVVAGGVDALCRLTFSGFDALSALSPEPCRPFDRGRTGLSLGEGAGFMVLEPGDHAIARGARPIAELRGWAIGAEAHHITNPEPLGTTACRVMRSALHCAGLSPSDLDYVNAHGTATKLNDVMEAEALRECLGPEVRRIPVSSSKGQIGHALAAAGALEAAIVAMAIDRGIVPPTGGLVEPDMECALVHVTESRPAPIRAAMSNSFGFGGSDASLIFAAPDAFPQSSAVRTDDVVVTSAATLGPLGVRSLLEGGVYLSSGRSPPSGIMDIDPSQFLDVARARRLDRYARLITVTIEAARRQSGLPLDATAACRVGAVFGSAFGNVDATAAYLRRLFDKGARLASPAQFPNLVPSSPVAHASIYLGLRGPVLSTANLDVSFGSAFETAAELVAYGQANAMFAGCAEQRSTLVDRCLGPTCSDSPDRGARSEGSAVLLLEERRHAVGRGARVVATVTWWMSWCGARDRGVAFAPPPRGTSEVFVVRLDDDIAACVRGTPWECAPRRAVARRAGDHEATLGFAAAAAVAGLARGSVDSALILGVARERGFATVLRREGSWGV
jgi:3-oxoacyl-[acyl-carrier-protein] synthase II